MRSSNSFPINSILLLMLPSLTYIIAEQQYQSNFNDGNQHQQIATSFINKENSNNDSLASQQVDSMSNFYSQNQKFRVNVSNVCEKSQMKVTVRLSRPFYGLIHTKDKRKKSACYLEGTGDQTYMLDISYTLVQSEPSYCGVVSYHSTQARSSQNISANQSSNQQQQIQHQTLSVVLVVRLHKTIEFSDDRYFLLSCANRCSRSDCSQANEANRQMGQTFRGFASSESVISPVLRSTGDSSARFVETLAGYASERDNNHSGSKFQWMVKLCWLLSGLLIIMFAMNFYLCFALSRSRIKSVSKIQRSGRSKMISAPIISSQSSQSENSSWSASALGADEIDKVRKENNYSIKQYQQHGLGSLVTNNTMLNSREGRHQEPILGRSGQNSMQKHKQLDARIRRRRSIGSSAVFAYETDQPLRPIIGKRMDMDQRAKSQSQTTIHYEQSQDPFKTVPFNYINNGYLSDDPNLTQFYSTDMGPCELATHQFVAKSLPNTYSSVQTSDKLLKPILNETTTLPRQHHQIELTDQQRWSTFKPAAALPDSSHQDVKHHHHQQHSSSSQFDPQNSRHLIDLIQLKHQQQLAQAYRTAATIKSNDLLDLQPQGVHITGVTNCNWR